MDRQNEKKYSTRGIIGTIIAHLLLLLFLYVSVMSTTPPEEEALLIDYSGGGSSSGSAGSSLPQPVESQPVELDKIERRLLQLKIEQQALSKEDDAFAAGAGA